MQRGFVFVFFLECLFLSVFASISCAGDGATLGSSADYYKQLITYITGDWQAYGEIFTLLQGEWFWKIFLAVITGIPAVFLLHYSPALPDNRGKAF
ncbi:MAG: hypothetical protein CSB28_02450 [Desulfobacterales bacterium]|nr:MAG: hypothetical protein CSB28_02450 [Desulfobacterales bacterium]